MSNHIVDIFDYMDYRQFLKAIYDYNKSHNKIFSYRYIGQKVGMEASFIVRVFQGIAHISDDSVERWSSFLKLEGKTALYFNALVHFCKTRSTIEREACFKKLISLRDFQADQITSDQFSFFEKWYHIPIRSLLGMSWIDKSPKVISKLLVPNISVEEVERSIELLIRLGLVLKDQDDNYTLKSDFITPDLRNAPALAVRSFQHQTIALADQALEQIPKQLRDISTVSITLDPNDLVAIQDQIVQFRQSIMEFSRECEKPTTMFQLNIQLFPLTNWYTSI
jgi:uncharacterized protein (TIGR02147 family)